MLFNTIFAKGILAKCDFIFRFEYPAFTYFFSGLQACVETHVLARVVTHVLVCYPMVQARVLLHVLARVVTHVLARVVTHVLARVIMHVHDYYLKTCPLDHQKPAPTPQTPPKPLHRPPLPL